jgi:hypothetical protein
MRRVLLECCLFGTLLLGCSSSHSDHGNSADAASPRPAHDAGPGANGADASSGVGHSARDAAPSAADRHDAAASADASPTGPGADDDAAARDSHRAFLLASSGSQLLVAGPDLGLQLTNANLEGDADLVSVHQEFYGVPWEALLAGSEPPAEWTAKMQALAKHAHSVSKRVFVSISMLNGGRDSLAARTKIENSQIKTEDNWAAHCYDFASAPDAAQTRAAYLHYVDRMIELFSPTYLNFAIEVNLFLEKCPDAAPGLIDMANAAYKEAKAKNPKLVAFPSFQIDHLYGYAKDACADGMNKDTCFDHNYAQITGLQRDRFAMSSYPYLQGQTAADLRRDWFERAPARGGERGLIAETGWLSTDLIAQNGTDCTTVVMSSEQQAADYLARVLSDAQRLPLELVTWWSNRDLVPAALMTNCPCDYSATWCSVVDQFRTAAGGPLTPGADFLGEVLLKAFGTMGLRDYDGKPKPKLAKAWNDARAQPLAP